MKGVASESGYRVLGPLLVEVFCGCFLGFLKGFGGFIFSLYLLNVGKVGVLGVVFCFLWFWGVEFILKHG